MTLTSTPISFAHEIFNGPFKLAIVTTHHHAGLYRNGIAICEAYPRDQWSIHWCSPQMTVEEAKAVLDHVATLPEYEPQAK